MPSPVDTDSQQGDDQQGPPPFGLVRRDLDATTCTIAVEGELDLATAPDLKRLLNDVLDAGSRVAVDLSKTVFIDSTALSVLLDAGRRLTAGATTGAAATTGAGEAGAGIGAAVAGAKTGGATGDADGEPRLAIVCTRPNVLRIFEFSGLDGAFAIFSTLEDALAYATGGG